MNGKAMASAWVGLTTLGQPRLSEGAQPYLKTGGCDVITSLPTHLPPPAKLPLLRSMPACQQIPTRPEAATASQQFTMPAVPPRPKASSTLAPSLPIPTVRACSRGFVLSSPRRRLRLISARRRMSLFRPNA